jgi:hypothetical protein
MELIVIGLQLVAPIVAQLIKWFFKSKKDQQRALVRFQKFINDRKAYVLKSKQINDAYKKQIAAYKEAKKKKVARLKNGLTNNNKSK